MQKFIDVKPVKRLASELLENTSVLRRVLLNEEDVLTATDYLAKLATWLVVLDSDLGGRETSA